MFSFFLSCCSPLTPQASTTAPTQPSLTPTSTPLVSSTNSRAGHSGEPGQLTRSAPDRKTIHGTYPSRHGQSSAASGDSRASTRHPNSGAMGFGDGTARHQQQTPGGASSMIGGTGTGAQSFLSKLSSKFARR